MQKTFFRQSILSLYEMRGSDTDLDMHTNTPYTTKDTIVGGASHTIILYNTVANSSPKHDNPQHFLIE